APPARRAAPPGSRPRSPAARGPACSPGAGWKRGSSLHEPAETSRNPRRGIDNDIAPMDCPGAGDEPPPRRASSDIAADATRSTLAIAGRGTGERARLAGEGGGTELRLEEVGVEAALGEQLGVGTALDEATPVEDEDHVGGEDRAQAVRDDQARAALHRALQRRLDQRLRLRVEVGGRL